MVALLNNKQEQDELFVGGSIAPIAYRLIDGELIYLQDPNFSPVDKTETRKVQPARIIIIDALSKGSSSTSPLNLHTYLAGT